MSESADKIPFTIEISRMIELLAKQIYPTPFALLRENVQNSFDAILQRKYAGQKFEPKIEVIIETKKVRVADNGKGMTLDELTQNFWRAGSSSKNTKEARAAGVVGTFGIGAMANFGIAEELIVETESAFTNERTFCSASRSTLSVTEDCIVRKTLEPTGSVGTTITAIIQDDKKINVNEAEKYISEFVKFLPIDVTVNSKLVSKNPITDGIPKITATWSFVEQGVDLGDGIKADVDLTGAFNGDIRIALQNFYFGSESVGGTMVLKQGLSTLTTFRSGFGLAATHISSLYQFGGIADFLFLHPTAGREALTTESVSLLQRIVTRVDELVSIHLGTKTESNVNAYFVSWAHQRKRYDLCSFLRVRIEPNDSKTLQEVRVSSATNPILVYPGVDPSTIQHASEDKPIVMLSRGNPRRECEIQYLRKYCKITEMDDNQKVLHPKSPMDLSAGERALAFRLSTILSSDYFVEANISYGKISHGLPLLVTNKKPITICLDPDGPTVRIVLGVFDNEYPAFDHLTKDFTRNIIFPKIQDLVPSSTRQGAEAFLKTINRTREIFEYEQADFENLNSLWQDYKDGKITLDQVFEASEKVAVRSRQFVDVSTTAKVHDIVPDVIQNESTTSQHTEVSYGPQPSIQRLDVPTDRKVLTIPDDEPDLKGYRLFLALTDKIKDERGDFFLQPHRTPVVWGGQKALFIFEHHSGNYGLYYDLQTQSLISTDSGGGSFETCTIVMKNRIFIPIPPQIQSSFLPKGNEKKRFDVRCDILYIDKK
jgi:molecular chaperone HtpG